ncbi:uncharacterized protein MONBRDRAFT_9233 [Monosiga brevicollis MX1]|uniref:Uncharacterized protein n=1 Tax=Monosiga brevicollis TaxID=81824 RepID=A9V2H8_MONBE|nr:uncharacterized protein MONBRDRAFT_9233 [Monosiga brevicollis MX1]EDQ88259.1 predicted protein [Monosiga brevicollis MX1]|eukprot:XP_001746852.1 hypothetical protein [Monosiga brevicollis MX1]
MASSPRDVRPARQATYVNRRASKQAWCCVSGQRKVKSFSFGCCDAHSTHINTDGAFVPSRDRTAKAPTLATDTEARQQYQARPLLPTAISRPGMLHHICSQAGALVALTAREPLLSPDAHLHTSQAQHAAVTQGTRTTPACMRLLVAILRFEPTVASCTALRCRWIFRPLRVWRGRIRLNTPSALRLNCTRRTFMPSEERPQATHVSSLCSRQADHLCTTSHEACSPLICLFLLWCNRLTETLHDDKHHLQQLHLAALHTRAQQLTGRQAASGFSRNVDTARLHPQNRNANGELNTTYREEANFASMAAVAMRAAALQRGAAFGLQRCQPVLVRHTTPLLCAFYRDRLQFKTLIQPCINDDLRLAELMLWFRERGHMVAELDPLLRLKRGVFRTERSQGEPERDSFDVESLLGWVELPGKKDQVNQKWTLPELFEHLADSYSGTLCAQEGLQSRYHVGDVKYHLGQEATFAFNRVDRKRVNPQNDYDPGQVEYVNLRLFPNPSHLEAIAPVIEGYTHAQQDIIRDDRRRKVMSILVHGDAAFSGLGSVYETMQLSQLEAFSTGGTIHVVINNQVGYTTPPAEAFSSGHATDIAKVAKAPIFHVNADDPEAVCEACFLAAEWRSEFASDVVVDIVGYRRFGHNEQDDPHATLPLTYQRIAKHPPVLQQYLDHCMNEKAVTMAQMERWHRGIKRRFDEDQARAATGFYLQKPLEFARDTVAKSGILSTRRTAQELTGLPIETLQFVGQAACDLSEAELKLHPNIQNMMRKRLKMVENANSRVDWAMAEALAIGTLSLHRDTGPAADIDQDVDPRKAALKGLNKGHHQNSSRMSLDRRKCHSYVRLANISPGGQDPVEIWNTPLNEFACLGFEYGASLSYEGPDHSSARMERFLQMMNDDPDFIPVRVKIETVTITGARISISGTGANFALSNFFVMPFMVIRVGIRTRAGSLNRHSKHSGTTRKRSANMFILNCSTPAQYFHALRRQLSAPRLGRRPNKSGEVQLDEPFAWEAREFLRKKLVGKQVTFTVDYTVPSGREYGTILLEPGTVREENVSHSLLGAGLAKLRDNARGEGEDWETMLTRQREAQEAKRGVWADDAASHVRNVEWNIENPRALVDSLKQKPVKAVIEQVRDGCTVRVMTLPDFKYLTIMLTGIKTPGFKRNAEGGEVPEPFALEAKFYVESRLLQREVEVILEGVSNNNFLGTVLHPQGGNISLHLLKDGFASVVDWSIGNVTQQRDTYRANQKFAQQRHLRLWKTWTPPAVSAIPEAEREFKATVEEIINAESLVIRTQKGSQRIHLASVRSPRPPAKGEGESRGRAPRLWEIPHAYEGREFLRKKLIGKKVDVHLDYIQPANNGYPEKHCCSVVVDKVNVGEALVSKGYATVLRYKADDDQRASGYDNLMAAETRAIKNKRGVHSTGEATPLRITEVSNKQLADRFLPGLQRAGRATGVVEHVVAGSRLRVMVPKDNCIASVVLAGVSCPRTGRDGAPDEPFAKEATEFTRKFCLQHDIEFEVEDTDKGGNMASHVYCKNLNLSQALLERGLAKLHPSVDRFKHAAQYKAAETAARDARKGVWANYDPAAEAAAEAARNSAPAPEVQERKTNYKPVVVTEIVDSISMYVQNEDTASLGDVMSKLKALDMEPPQNFPIKKNQMIAAQFSQDMAWYRARVLQVNGDDVEVGFLLLSVLGRDRRSVHGLLRAVLPRSPSLPVPQVQYVDFGNSESVSKKDCAPLPAGCNALAPQAQLVKLAFLKPVPEDWRNECCQVLRDLVLNKKVLCNTEYTEEGVPCVTLKDGQSDADLTTELVTAGYGIVAPRREPAFRSIIQTLMTQMNAAKSSRAAIWVYGDITEDEPF